MTVLCEAMSFFICYKGAGVDRWLVPKGSPDGVSVSPNGNVVVAVRDSGHLIVFSPTGQVVKEIKLPAELASPRHAYQLMENDQFLLCYGWGNSAYGIHVVDGDGHIIKSSSSSSSSSSAAAATAAIPAGSSPRPESFTPTHLALDHRGNVLVAEFAGSTVQLYNKRLDYVADVVLQSSGLKQPFRLCLDETADRLYIGEYSGGGRVLVFGK